LIHNAHANAERHNRSEAQWGSEEVAPELWLPTMLSAGLFAFVAGVSARSLLVNESARRWPQMASVDELN